MARCRILAAIALALGTSACGVSAFQCDSNEQCSDERMLGTCQPDGWCSFPDIECESGQRYGEHAGGGLAGECVGEDIGTTGTADDGNTSISTTLTTSASSSASTTMVPETCGNGIIDELEACDGDVADSTCATFGFSGGTLACAATCQWDFTGCMGCGNGILEEGEACEGFDVQGQDCTDFGFSTGTLQCIGCQFDTSLCTNCGNGTLDPNEECDGENLAKKTCATEGFVGGTLVCSPSCTFDTSGCHNCGNMALDEEEVCETGVLGGQTCASLGYGSGTLGCTSDCRTFDTTACTGLQCGADPTMPLPGDCPPQCASCLGNTCNVDCTGNGACSGTSIDCPPGWACMVTCDGNDACSNTTVDCPEHWGCSVTCNDNSACSNTLVECSTDGACSLVCGSGGGGLCNGAQLLCGLDSCTSSCPVNADVIVQCGESCGCLPC